MSSSEDLATPCLQPCTPALPDGSGHNTASCHLLPAQGRPLPPPGHGLIVSRKCLQPLLSMSSWALLPGVGAGPRQARTGSDMLPHGPCCYMQTPPVGASQPRSEEHTSELQSLRHLVCRLLLEKKKKPDHVLTAVSSALPR